MVTKQQQLEWLANKYKTWPEQGSPYLGLSAVELGKFAIVNSHTITRTEWQQERDKMQQQQAQPVQSAQNNSWYERGDLPPVGCECEMKHTCWSEFQHVFVLAITRQYVIVSSYSTPEIEQHYHLREITFRPLRTEREKAIDELIVLVGDIEKYPTWRDAIVGIIDAGYRKQ